MTTQKLTITEALAEIKTLEKRINSKRTSIGPYMARMEGVKDPLEKSGGSVAFIKAERQAIGDLQNNIVKLRVGINRANDATSITIQDETKTISEWIIWRRDVSKGAQQVLSDIRSYIAKVRSDAQRQGVGVVTTNVSIGTDLKPTDFIINVDEAELLKEIEKLETILSTLDGQLSLKNATTFVEIN